MSRQRRGAPKSVIAGTRVPVNRADRELGDVRNLLGKGREIIVSSLCWIAGTIWQSCNLALQGKVFQTLGRRFRKLREDGDTLSSVQKDADYAVQHPIATGPDNALDKLEQQMAEAEHRRSCRSAITQQPIALAVPPGRPQEVWLHAVPIAVPPANSRTGS